MNTNLTAYYLERIDIEIKNYPDGFTCEWCGMSYPRTGYDYYFIIVLNKNHVICRDCFDHLVKVD